VLVSPVLFCSAVRLSGPAPLLALAAQTGPPPRASGRLHLTGRCHGVRRAKRPVAAEPTPGGRAGWAMSDRRWPEWRPRWTGRRVAVARPSMSAAVLTRSGCGSRRPGDRPVGCGGGRVGCVGGGPGRRVGGRQGRRVVPAATWSAGRRVDGWLDRRLAGSTVGWIDGWLDRRLAGSTVGWADG
jgi:hypothetical protein